MSTAVAERPRAVVVCIGNELVADDGVGPAVHAALAGAPALPGVKLVLLGTGGLALLDELDGEGTLVVVDAVAFGAPPGTVHVLSWDRLPEARGLPVTSHGIGVREVVGIGRVLFPERMPTEVTLIGVEGQCFDQFAAMTQEVAAAVPEAVRTVLRLVQAGAASTGPASA